MLLINIVQKCETGTSGHILCPEISYFLVILLKEQQRCHAMVTFPSLFAVFVLFNDAVNS